MQNHSEDFTESAQRLAEAERQARLRAQTYQNQSDASHANAYADGLQRAGEILREVYEGIESKPEWQHA